MTSENKRLFSGKIAFELYDTYGFPLDLTQMILREKGIEIDVDEFDRCMIEQKERSKANWVGSGDRQTNELYLQIEDKTTFTGYGELISNGKILKLIKNNSFVNSVEKGDNIEVIVDNTCFYGESGGQIGDSGMAMLVNDDGSIILPCSAIQINNTIKTTRGVIIHRGIVEMGSFKVGDRINLGVDKIKRNKITANHSATHLLHFALKRLLGSSVNQKGSYVDDKRLRLDVSYNGIIEDKVLAKAEEIVNDIIIKNTETKTELMNLEDAKNSGAMALFSEKYGDVVRVVSMGSYDVNNDNNGGEENFNFSNGISSKDNFCSKELCGGTHVKRTGDIGFFKIVKEESIASGVRRIEAITGVEALNYVNNKISVLDGVANGFKISYDRIQEKIESILKENKDLKKKIAELEKSKLNDIKFTVEKFKNINIIYKNLENVNPQDLKQVIIQWQNTKYVDKSMIVATIKNENKFILIVSLSKDLIENNNLNAVELFKKLDGRGGGAANFAMGGVGGFIKLDDVEKVLSL